MTPKMVADVPDGVLDAAQFDGFRRLAAGMGDPSFLRTLIDQYLEEASSQMTQVRQAANRGDLPAVRQLAHSLNGTSATMGAVRVASAAAVIERSAARGELADACRFETLSTELRRATKALRAEVAD